MPKIKNIEFLRVIGCLAIILLHLFNNARLHGMFGDIEIYDKLFKMTHNGQKAVDLFFIISGFFFALKLDIAKGFWEFLKGKLIRLYPVLIFVTVLHFIASLFGVMNFTLYDNILSIIGLNGTSLILTHGNIGVFWYISAMLWTFALFLYLLKNYNKKNVELFIALLIFFCYSFILHAKGGKINHNIQTFYHIFNIGMMRAFGGIGIGYFIAKWYSENLDWIKKLNFTIKAKIAISTLEFICLYFIINNLILHKLHYKNDIIYIISFATIIILFLLKQGFFSKLLNKDLWVKLSQYTYSFYGTHLFVLMTLKGSLWKHHPEWVYAHPIENVVYTLILVFILGIFTYHFVEAPCARYFSQKAKNAATKRERESNILSH